MRIETWPGGDLGPALAAEVAEHLIAAVEARASARLAVPGGTTPGPFLTALGRVELPWAHVRVVPTDERCVPADHPRSNARLIRSTLLAGRAEDAELVPLWPGDPAERAAEALPLDIAVLGMGEDMHTASLFPGSPELAAALAPDAPAALAVTAPGQPEARITLPARVLAAAPAVFVLIRGAAKRRALEAAMEADDPMQAPVAAVLRAARAPVVYYAD